MADVNKSFSTHKETGASSSSSQSKYVCVCLGQFFKSLTMAIAGHSVHSTEGRRRDGMGDDRWTNPQRDHSMRTCAWVNWDGYTRRVGSTHARTHWLLLVQLVSDWSGRDHRPPPPPSPPLTNNILLTGCTGRITARIQVSVRVVDSFCL